MVLTVFAVKYTYLKPQNILINPKNVLMISYTYQAKFCRTTPANNNTYLMSRIKSISVYGEPRALFSIVQGWRAGEAVERAAEHDDGDPGQVGPERGQRHGPAPGEARLGRHQEGAAGGCGRGPELDSGQAAGGGTPGAQVR